MPQGKGFLEHVRKGKQFQLTKVDLAIKAIEGSLRDPRHDERYAQKLRKKRDALIIQRNQLAEDINDINKTLRRNG